MKVFETMVRPHPGLAQTLTRPESPPPTEDVKKVERRLTIEHKKSLKKPDVLKKNKKP